MPFWSKGKATMNQGENYGERALLLAKIAAKERVAFIRSFVDLPEAIGNPDAQELAPNQLFSISAYERLQGLEKGRQEGQSFAYALDSVAGAILEANSNGVHVSTDKWESEKKQKYCLRIIEALRRSARAGVKIVSEAKNHLELETRDDEGKPCRSSIDFLACRPPRGADRGKIYLHEGAHMPNIDEILKAGIGCTAHGGYIRMCGTHQGSGTTFNKVITNAPDDFGRHPYRNWVIGSFPWWTFPGFCIDPMAAIVQAPNMETADRVERFGNWILKDLFYSYGLEDFQEEFECIVLDERHSFYPDFLIKGCQPQTDEAIANYWFEAVTLDGKKPGSLSEGKDVILALQREIMSNRLDGEWLWAMDVGRRKDKDEITIGHVIQTGNKKLTAIRAVITMDNMPFGDKETMIHFLLKELPVTKGYIDATGMGMQLSENFHTTYGFGQRAMPLTFTNELKSMMANDFKIKMQQGSLLLPIFPALTKQIHAIKKDVTKSGHETYSVDANKEHHGDKFWSAAMMSFLSAVQENVFGFMPGVVTRDSQQNNMKNPYSNNLILPGGQSLPSPNELWGRFRR